MEDQKPASPIALEPFPWGVPAPAPTNQDLRHYLEFVTFLVEDSLYKVPRYQFTKSAELYRIISLGAVTEDTPVVLNDVTKDEFNTLLELISDPGVPQRPFCHQEWAVVLKLASRWMFSELRKLAITNLSSHSWTVKVPLARAYGVREWLHSAYTDLASRSTSPTMDEATVLGLDATAILFAIREEPLQRNREEHMRRQAPKGNENPYEKGVDEEFVELDLEGEDAVQKVLIAKQQLAVAPEWLRTAYIRLVERKKTISLAEATQLGLETTVKVCRAREKALRTYPNHYGSSNLSIEKEFEVELSSVAVSEARYRRLPVVMPTLPRREGAHNKKSKKKK
ncbi:hypothetical protein H0H81_004075 [Sphagnurus paluster]|uniref:Uncharacterized protein n=1 Tax=Sphagnurus paluster TaxID=117069 RepID=A0A9P7GSK0_9AGAR|nr:hypothetical protein H0H81_004075 [Sphagnurus paluster]